MAMILVCHSNLCTCSLLSDCLLCTGRSLLSYYTDTGAYYWYNTVPGKNYQDTLKDIKEWHVRAKLPVGIYELDSWWYFKSGGSKAEHGGIKLWEPRPEIFPVIYSPFMSQ
jgi:hypothetical protein